MTTKADLEEFVDIHFKIPYSDEIKKNIKESFELLPVVNANRDEKATPVITKFGGLPDLPINIDWPRDSRGFLYNFLLQIRLADLVSSQERDLLPKEGILYFFVDSYSLENSKVYYADDSVKIRTNVAPPPNLKRSFWQRLSRYRDFFKIFDEFELNIKLRYTAASLDALYLEKIFRKYERKITSPMELRVADSYHESFNLTSNEANVIKHQMLGHYKGKQHSSQELYLNKHSYKPPSKLTDNELDALLDHILLLKIDSDKRIGFSWADFGCLFFFISKEDLVTRNFDNVKMILDTY